MGFADWSGPQVHTSCQRCGSKVPMTWRSGETLVVVLLKSTWKRTAGHPKVPVVFFFFFGKKNNSFQTFIFWVLGLVFRGSTTLLKGNSGKCTWCFWREWSGNVAVLKSFVTPSRSFTISTKNPYQIGYEAVFSPSILPCVIGIMIIIMIIIILPLWFLSSLSLS